MADDTRARVLVADDEYHIREGLKEGLERENYVVDMAKEGGEAWERIRSGNYQAGIFDLKMPRIDGPTFYRRVTETMPSLATRFIFVTGNVAGTDAEPFLAETGCRWLAKPFRLNDLLRLVREIVG